MALRSAQWMEALRKGLALLTLCASGLATYLAVSTAYLRLLHPGCIERLLGGPKPQVSCIDGVLATGAAWLYGAIAWWAVFGLLSWSPFAGAPHAWPLLRTTSKFAGGIAGGVVVVLYVIPAVVIFFAYIVIPFILLAVAALVAAAALLVRAVIH